MSDGSIPDQEITDLFKQVVEGQEKFTRRMAITMGDILGFGPMTMVLRLENMGLLKRGSFDWFKTNGGITRSQVEQARNEAANSHS